MSQSVSADPALAAAQRRAIAESGWGEPFRLWQPHNLAFWVWLLGVAAGLVAFIQLITSISGVYTPAVVGGIAIWAAFLVPWIVFLRHKDRYEREPARLAAAGFFWGGLAAAFAIALPGNDAVIGILSKLVSPVFAATWGPAISAPVVEESAKLCGVVLLIGMAPRLVRSAYDGLILGAFVGLGFQVFEDWLYTVQAAATNLGENQAGSILATVLIRGTFAGLFSHALFTGLTGMGLIWLIGRPGEARRPLRGAALIAAGVLGHAAWDAAAVAGLPLLIPVTAVILLVTVIFAERAAAYRERWWMWDLMAPEVARGTITPTELQALSGRYRDRRYYVRTAWQRGQTRRQAHHVTAACLDLAEEIARSGGRETDVVAFTRSEVLRVQGLPAGGP